MEKNGKLQTGTRDRERKEITCQTICFRKKRSTEYVHVILEAEAQEALETNNTWPWSLST
jgi:hypothetical protein